jgi:hypothetical protein
MGRNRKVVEGHLWNSTQPLLAVRETNPVSVFSSMLSTGRIPTYQCYYLSPALFFLSSQSFHGVTVTLLCYDLDIG